MSTMAPVRTTPWTSLLKERWPTALAALAALAFVGGGSGAADEAVSGLGEMLLLLPLLYLLVAKLGRRRATWPALAAGSAVLFAVPMLDVVSLPVVLVAVALAVLVWGAAGGALHRPGPFRAQALGMAFFGALALAGLAVDPDLGRYLVAAGWFLHGVWDFVHLRLDKVVSRSFAEWCGILDILVAAQLLFLV